MRKNKEKLTIFLVVAFLVIITLITVYATTMSGRKKAGGDYSSSVISTLEIPGSSSLAAIKELPVTGQLQSGLPETSDGTNVSKPASSTSRTASKTSVNKTNTQSQPVLDNLPPPEKPKNSLVEAVKNKNSSSLSGKDKEIADKAISVINQVIKAGMTPAEKAAAIHDYMLVNTAYDYENYLAGSIPSDSYHPYGALILKKAVCNGYAEVFKLFMDVLEISCEFVSGTARGGGSHAWNALQIDGQWYFVDVTWDDPVPDQGPNWSDYTHFLAQPVHTAGNSEWNNKINKDGYGVNGTVFTIPSYIKENSRLPGVNRTAIKELVLPNNWTYIRDSFVTGWRSVEKITIGNNVKKIESNAFAITPNLKTLTIPSSVETIGASAFYESGIETLTLECKIKKIESHTFSLTSNLKTLTLPNSVELIDQQAFYESGIETINFGNGLKTISMSAFLNCKSLKTLTIPDSVTSIENYAFSGCTALYSIRIGSGIKKLGTIFRNCISLKSITIPGTVEEVSGFGEGCVNIESITLEPGIKKIGMYAFYYCEKVKNYNIPDSVSVIEPSAFPRGSTIVTSRNHMLDYNDQKYAIEDYAAQNGCMIQYK